MSIYVRRACFLLMVFLMMLTPYVCAWAQSSPPPENESSEEFTLPTTPPPEEEVDDTPISHVPSFAPEPQSQAESSSTEVLRPHAEVINERSTDDNEADAWIVFGGGLCIAVGITLVGLLGGRGHKKRSGKDTQGLHYK